MASLKNKGIGLLELMLSLAIIAVLLIMATRYFKTAETSQQVEEAAKMVTAVYTAGDSWMQDHSQFGSQNMMGTFAKLGWVPKDFANATTKPNPWGGEITAQAGATPKILKVGLSKVPQDACQNLAARFKAKMPGSDPSCGADSITDFTVNFNYGDI